jgi:hypothetical protein
MRIYAHEYEAGLTRLERETALRERLVELAKARVLIEALRRSTREPTAFRWLYDDSSTNEPDKGTICQE